VAIVGRAKRPVYVWINDGKVEIRDATKLWGKRYRGNGERSQGGSRGSESERGGNRAPPGKTWRKGQGVAVHDLRAFFAEVITTIAQRRVPATFMASRKLPSWASSCLNWINGIPTRRKLLELGLEDFAKKLYGY